MDWGWRKMGHVFINKRSGGGTPQNKHFWAVRRIVDTNPKYYYTIELPFDTTSIRVAKELRTATAIRYSDQCEVSVEFSYKFIDDGGYGSFTLTCIHEAGETKLATWLGNAAPSVEESLNVDIAPAEIENKCYLYKVRTVGSNAFEITFWFDEAPEWELIYEDKITFITADTRYEYPDFAFLEYENGTKYENTYSCIELADPNYANSPIMRHGEFNNIKTDSLFICYLGDIATAVYNTQSIQIAN